MNSEGLNAPLFYEVCSMLIFEKLKETLFSNTKVKDNVQNYATSLVLKKTVLGDILENPENFKIEAFFEGREIILKITPKDKYIDVYDDSQ